MTAKSFLKLSACIALPLMVGGFSGFIIRNDITGWYATLAKPSFNPPNYLFGPVWTTLYILMGISFYMIMNSAAGKNRNMALAAFGIQLFLNFWWSIIFFSLHLTGFALAEIGLLWACIAWMIFAFIKIKPLAGYLQIPYLFWVTFASSLNFAILILN